MPRGYRSDTIAIANTTAATYVFNANLLPQGGIKDLHIIATGNNYLRSIVTQVVVKLEGVEVINLTGAQLEALQEVCTTGQTAYGANGIVWTIPMGLPSTMSGIWPMAAAVSGIPFGLNVSVEVSVSASSATGTLQIGWTTLEAPPTYMLKIVKQATGVGASTTAPVPVNYGMNDCIGVILANGSNILSKLRCVSRLPNGQEFQFSDMSNTMMQGLMLDYSPRTITDPLVYFFDRPYKLPPNSYLEFTSGSGAAVTNVFATIQTVDVRPATS